jgi:hypothetical protein
MMFATFDTKDVSALAAFMTLLQRVPAPGRLGSRAHLHPAIQDGLGGSTR